MYSPRYTTYGSGCPHWFFTSASWPIRSHPIGALTKLSAEMAARSTSTFIEAIQVPTRVLGTGEAVLAHGAN